jgi:hypothetical protein
MLKQSDTTEVIIRALVNWSTPLCGISFAAGLGIDAGA